MYYFICFTKLPLCANLERSSVGYFLCKNVLFIKLSVLLTKCFNSTLQDFYYTKILSLRQCSFAFVRHMYITNTLLVLNVKIRKARPIYDHLVLNDKNCLGGKANNFQPRLLNFGWRSTCAYLTVCERQCLNQAVVLQQLRVVLI